MISKVGQIMLYVNKQAEAVNFRTEKVGFSVISEEDNNKVIHVQQNIQFHEL